MRGATLLCAAATALASCGGLDKLLEGSQPSEARFEVVLAASAVTITAGRDSTLAVTITRTAGYAGAVSLAVEGMPDGVTAEVGGTAATGQVTSATVTLRVGAATAPGRYPLRVRGKAPSIPVDGVAALVLDVAAPPAYTITMSQTSFTIARGGIAPAAVQLGRTNFTAPVTLVLQGAPQVAAAFQDNPLTGSAAAMTLSVPADVVPGLYQATLRGSSPGMTDRTVPLSITVTDDPLQLLTSPSIEAGQGSVVTAGVVINRPGVSGAVTLSAENLPTGVSASFEPSAPSGTAGTLTLTIQPTVPASTYTLRLRGRGTGVPDATVEFQLRISPSGLAMTFTPGSVTVYQGTGTTVRLTLTRTALPGAIALEIPGLPAGLSATADPVSATGSLATLVVQASNGLPAGEYPVTVRAVPASWPPGASLEGTFTLVVRPAFPASEGNFRLDWSGCTPPDWVATIQGGSPLGWRQLTPVSGRVQFQVSSTGGIAWVESGNTVNVRWLTSTDVPGTPVDMCPPPPPARGKTITGQAVHFSALEQFRFSLGGVTATTTVDASTIVLADVLNGVHDLLGWGEVSIGYGLRGLLRRDVDAGTTTSLGPVDLTGPESFAPVRPTLSVTGVGTGETINHSVSYATTVACTVNPLYSGVTGSTATMAGVPQAAQRENDFHLVTVAGTTGARIRTITTSFQALVNRAIVLPALTGVPAVSSLAGSHKRLQVNIGTVPGTYNGGVSFRYTDGVRSMVMSATLGFTGSVGVVLAMPDFSGVAGWPAAAAIPASGTGGWTLTAVGTSGGGSSCSEGRTSVSLLQSGAY